MKRLLCLSSLLLFLGPVAGAPMARPNIVLILADDLGIVDINTYAARFTRAKPAEMFYETPHLDRLVREGVAFSQAYASHLCSPARVSVLTGKNAARLGFTTAVGGNVRTFYNQAMTPPPGYLAQDALEWVDKGIRIPQALLNGTTLDALPSGHPLDQGRDEITLAEAGQQRMAIGRQAVVTRHNIRVTSSSDLQVGNGEFAITTDISGLISFSNHPILAHWGWHSDPLPAGETIDDFKWPIHRGYDGRERPYPLPNGSEIGKWLMSNPHKANLGRLGLVLIKGDGSTAGLKDLQKPEQTLDLWKGLLTSQYDIDGQPVKVETSVHPTLDAIAVRISSPLIAAGRLRIKLTFPHPNVADGGTGDFNRPDAHTSTMKSRGSRRADIARTADATLYNVGLAWAGRGKLENPARHEFLLSPEAANQFEFVCAFTPQALPETLPSTTETIDACAKHWPDFWNSGGAIDLLGSSDSRWRELERRIVISQYAMAVNEAGSYPPPESGLRKDPWHGRFHFEMIWWHGTHWALWDRWPLLNRYIDIYAAAAGERRVPGQEAVTPTGLAA